MHVLIFRTFHFLSACHSNPLSVSIIGLLSLPILSSSMSRLRAEWLCNDLLHVSMVVKLALMSQPARRDLLHMTGLINTHTHTHVGGERELFPLTRLIKRPRPSQALLNIDSCCDLCRAVGRKLFLTALYSSLLKISHHSLSLSGNIEHEHGSLLLMKEGVRGGERARGI